jgi:hypothetical protein
MIEHSQTDDEIQAQIEAALAADHIYVNQILSDEHFRDNLPRSSQLITPRDESTEALFRARSEARSYVRREKTAVVFDPASLTAYIYEPHQPLRILRGNPNPPPEEKLTW